MRRSSDDEEAIERQAAAAGVAASVFGQDVMVGRAERIGSLENGPRRTTVHVNRVDHMIPADQPRRVTSAKELHELADMAEAGISLPGTLAHAKLATAMEDGDDALAYAIRARVKELAPQLRTAAFEQDKVEQQQWEDDCAAQLKGVDAATFEQARAKRARKAARRRHDAGLN